jgi:hypothetical protein
MQSTKHFLKQQFQRLTLKPGAPIESPAVSAWSEIAGKMVDAFGEDKFALAVMRWLEQEQFFPSNPNDLRKYLPTAQRETCVMCRESEGWVFSDYEHDGRLIKNAARRCLHPGRTA